MAPHGDCKGCGRKRISLPARGLCWECYRDYRKAEAAAVSIEPVSATDELVEEPAMTQEVTPDAVELVATVEKRLAEHHGVVAAAEDAGPAPQEESVSAGVAEVAPAAAQVGGSHYLSKAVQPWAAMAAWLTREEFAGFLRGNVIKYVARFRDKGGVEDLRKARHYLDRLIEHEESKHGA